MAEQVRVRAYYLSLERGESPQDPLHDWLRAEQEFSVGSAAHD